MWNQSSLLLFDADNNPSGFSVDCLDVHGRTPLHYATLYNNQTAVQVHHKTQPGLWTNLWAYYSLSYLTPALGWQWSKQTLQGQWGKDSHETSQVLQCESWEKHCPVAENRFGKPVVGSMWWMLNLFFCTPFILGKPVVVETHKEGGKQEIKRHSSSSSSNSKVCVIL